MVDGISAQGSLYNSFLRYFDGRGQRAGAQVHRQVLSLLLGACAANLAGVVDEGLRMSRGARARLIGAGLVSGPPWAEVGPVLAGSRRQF